MNTFLIVLLILACFAVVMVIGSFIVGLVWTLSFKGAVNYLKLMIESLPYLLGWLISYMVVLSIVGWLLSVIS